MRRITFLLSVLIWLGSTPLWAGSTVLTFDDITSNDWAVIPGGYGGLNWSGNFTLGSGTAWGAGYGGGMVSPNHVAYNNYAADVEMTGDPFSVVGAYMAGAWNDGLNVDIAGYRSGELIYSHTAVVNATSPTWVQLSFDGVDRVTFHSYGGTHHDEYGLHGTQFVMDNLTLQTIPAPGAILLGLAGTGLVGALRRRRMI